MSADHGIERAIVKAEENERQKLYTSRPVHTPFALEICVCSHAKNVFFNAKTHDLKSIFLFVNRQVKCLTDGEKKIKKIYRRL